MTDLKFNMESLNSENRGYWYHWVREQKNQLHGYQLRLSTLSQNPARLQEIQQRGFPITEAEIARLQEGWENFKRSLNLSQCQIAYCTSRMKAKIAVMIVFTNHDAPFFVCIGFMRSFDYLTRALDDRDSPVNSTAYLVLSLHAHVARVVQAQKGVRKFFMLTHATPAMIEIFRTKALPPDKVIVGSSLDDAVTQEDYKRIADTQPRGSAREKAQDQYILDFAHRNAFYVNASRYYYGEPLDKVPFYFRLQTFSEENGTWETLFVWARERVSVFLKYGFTQSRFPWFIHPGLHNGSEGDKYLLVDTDALASLSVPEETQPAPPPPPFQWTPSPAEITVMYDVVSEWTYKPLDLDAPRRSPWDVNGKRMKTLERILYGAILRDSVLTNGYVQMFHNRSGRYVDAKMLQDHLHKLMFKLTQELLKG